MTVDIYAPIKIDDYTGIIPTPIFMPHMVLLHVENYPNAISNGFLIEFRAGNYPNDRFHTTKIFPEDLIISMIITASMQVNCLSKPKYVIEYFPHIKVFVCFINKKECLSLQMSYYNYFIYRYKDCYFTAGNANEVVGVWSLDSELVGLVMPVVTPTNKAEYYE